MRARAITVALLLGCPGAGGGDADAGGGTDTEGGPELVAPVFVEPVNDLVQIPVTRGTDLVLPVSQITLGLTRVFLNGQSIGPLSAASRIGSLTSDVFTLHLTGGMVPGDHTLQLRTPGSEDEPLTSREIAVELSAQITAFPEASVGDTVAFEADVIVATGYDDDGLLLGLDLQSDPPMARVHQGAGTGWNVGAPVMFALDGLEPDDEPTRTIAADIDRAGPGPDDDRLRVAWRAGLEGTSIIVSDSQLVDPHPTPRPVLEVGDIVGSAEYARFGRPMLFGRTVVAEALRAVDVEQPLPGERTLATVRFEGNPISPGPPQLTSVAGQHDIELLSPAIDLLGHQTGGPYTFAARVSGVRPVVFTVDRESGELSTVVTQAADSLSLLSDLAMPMLTVLGAFESRQVFAPLRGGNEGARLLIRHFVDGDAGGASDASPSTADLAAIGDPTADAVATLVHGAPIYVVPMGLDTPAFAFVSTGPAPLVGPIEGLQCDEIAFPISTEANRGDAVQLACRRERVVLLGTLHLPEPG